MIHLVSMIDCNESQCICHIGQEMASPYILNYSSAAKTNDWCFNYNIFFLFVDHNGLRVYIGTVALFSSLMRLGKTSQMGRDLIEMKDSGTGARCIVFVILRFLSPITG